MRKSVYEIRRIYRAGANLFFNFTAPLLLERFRPINGHLQLAANIHSHLELEKLFQHIAANGGVNSLSLRDNALGYKDMEIVARYLGNTGIRNLNLSLNKIDDEGVEILAGNLSKLRILDLTDNKIGLIGAQALLKSLHNNRFMQNLSLGGNSLFGVNAGLLSHSLLELMKSNRELRYLSLEPMPLPAVSSKQDLEEISGAASNNPWLEKILYAKQVGRSRKGESWSSVAMEASSDYVPEVSICGPGISTSTKDATNDYAIILLVRMIRKIVADKPEISLDSEMVKSLELAAKVHTEEVLLRDLTKKEIKNFSDIWHGGFRQTCSQKLRNYGNESWASLTKEKEIEVPIKVAEEEGWKLINLENAQELKEEGSALRHCVGGYSGRCISGQSHILSLRKDGQPFSTLELGMANGEVRIKQHLGVENSTPDKSQQKIVQWFVDGVNDKSIARPSYDVTKRNKGLVSLIGFDPFDDTKFREVVSEFKNKILPSNKLEIPALTRNFREVFLGEIRLDDGMFDYPKGLTLKSLRAEEERTSEEKLKEKVVGIAQTSLNRIVGRNKSGAPVAKVSLIEGELFIFTDAETSEIIKSLLLKGQVEDRNDGLKIIGKPEEVRQFLAQAGKEERKARRKAKDDSDLPRTAVRSAALISHDTSDLQRD